MNVMNEYIKITEKQITNYFRLVLGSKFIRKISDEFLKTYIEARYYFIDENKSRNVLKSEILKKLDNKKSELVKEYPEYKLNIEYFRTFYNYCLYFDYVIQIKDIEKLIEKITEKREQLLKREDENLKNELYQMLENNKEDMEAFLKKFDSNSFYLELKKIAQNSDIQNVELNYKIKFSILYSQFAIQKAFETGNVSEDKQFVKYYLLSKQVITDIMEGKIKRQYLVEFTDTIFKKKQKLKRLLEIIDNAFIQERISLVINYASFIQNKTQYYDLIQKGFKFAIVMDQAFKPDNEELKRLEMFKYVILDKNLRYYDEIIKNKELVILIEK